MSVNLRLDQTVTFTVDWKDSLGNPAAAPADAAVHVGTSAIAAADEGGGVYKVTPQALATDVAIAVASANANATDTVTVEGGAATSGTIVWGTPTPA